MRVDQTEDTAATATGAPPAPAPVRVERIHSTELQAGARVGRHLIRRTLGGGGMGMVYAALDPQLGREVALKVIRRQPTHKRRRALIREARALAAVNHPNVVTVHEVSDAEHDPLYISMELVAGQTLRAWLDEEPRSVAQIRRVFADAARGLLAAHEQGLVHGDFKPANVMLDERGRVVVLDFGLAHFDDAAIESADPTGETPLAGALSQVTQGGFRGTIGYVAPELMRYSGRSSTRSDQFSFCVSLWEALYGRRPFRRDDASDASFERDPKHKRRVPKLLQRALVRGLSPDPDARFDSMHGLIEALEHRGYARRWAAGALLVGGLAALGGSALEARRAEAERQARIQACANAGRTLDSTWTPSARAEGAASFAATELDHASAVWQQIEAQLDSWSERWATQRELLCVQSEVEGQWAPDRAETARACLSMREAEFEAVLERLYEADAGVVGGGISLVSRLPPPERCLDELALAQRLVPEDPDTRARVLDLRLRALEADIEIRVGHHSEGRSLAQAVFDEAEALGWTPLRAEATLSLATAVHLDEGADAGRPLHRRALMLALEVDHYEVAALATTALVGLETGENRYEFADHWRELAEVLLARAGLEHSLEAARLYTNIGVAYNDQNRLEEAVETYERALELWTETLGPEHPDLGAVYVNLANTLDKLDQPEAAERAARRSLRSLETGYGPDHQNVAIALINLARLVSRRGQHDANHAYLTRALTILETHHGAKDIRVALVLNNLGSHFGRLGDYAQAQAYAERALAIREAAAPDHPRVGSSLVNLGVYAYESGELERALAYHERALALYGQAYEGTTHPRIPRARLHRGQTLLAMGELERAAPDLASALEHYRERGPDKSLALALLTTGQLELARGEPQSARSLFDEVLELDAPQASLLEARLGLARAQAALAPGGGVDEAQAVLVEIDAQLAPARALAEPARTRALRARVLAWLAQPE